MSTDTETPAATLRRAADQARADAMTTTGQTRNIGLAYARGLEHDADRADRGETGHLPPALASARFYLETPPAPRTQPREGLCLGCMRRLPLFPFHCDHAGPWGFTRQHELQLCTRCWSHGTELREDDKYICSEMTFDLGDDWDPFTAPTPGTILWKLQQGPIGRIRSYDGTKADATAEGEA